MNKRTILLLLLFSVALAFYSQNAFADGSYACNYSGDCSDTGTSPFSGSGCYPSDLTGTYTAVCKLGVTYSCSYCSNGCTSGACNPAPAPTDPCATVTCSTPPSPTCSGSNLITYGQGTCTNGACNYRSMLSLNCPNGCTAGACNQAPTPQCIDNDGDGYGQNCAKGTDCNDNNAAVNPGVTEPSCDADTIDNDCKNGDAPACTTLINIGGGSGGGVSPPASCDSSTAVDLYVNIASAVIENDQVKIAFLTPSKNPVSGGCVLRFKVGIMLNNNLVDTVPVEVPNPAAQFKYSFAVSKLQKGSNNLRIIADYYKAINDIDRSNNEDSTTISGDVCGDERVTGDEQCDFGSKNGINRGVNLDFECSDGKKYTALVTCTASCELEGAPDCPDVSGADSTETKAACTSSAWSCRWSDAANSCGTKTCTLTDTKCSSPDAVKPAAEKKDCPQTSTCTDKVQNGDETGIDCGGSKCAVCPGVSGTGAAELSAKPDLEIISEPTFRLKNKDGVFRFSELEVGDRIKAVIVDVKNRGDADVVLKGGNWLWYVTVTIKGLKTSDGRTLSYSCNSYNYPNVGPLTDGKFSLPKAGEQFKASSADFPPGCTEIRELGEYKVTVTIDSTGVIDESNEGNNVKEFTVPTPATNNEDSTTISGDVCGDERVTGDEECDWGRSRNGMNYMMNLDVEYSDGKKYQTMQTCTASCKLERQTPPKPDLEIISEEPMFRLTNRDGAFKFSELKVGDRIKAVIVDVKNSGNADVVLKGGNWLWYVTVTIKGLKTSDGRTLSYSCNSYNYPNVGPLTDGKFSLPKAGEQFKASSADFPPGCTEIRELGEYNVMVTVDSTGVIDESNEGNNVKEFAVPTPATKSEIPGFNLQKGGNVITVSTDMVGETLDGIKGDCRIANAWIIIGDEWKTKPLAEKFTSADSLKGSWLWVEVESSCSFNRAKALVCPSKIDFAFDKDTYRVGDTATIRLATYDENGNPVGADLMGRTTRNGEEIITEGTGTTKPSGIVTISQVAAESEDVGSYKYTITQSDACAAVGRYISATASITVLPSESQKTAISQKAQADESSGMVKIISGSKQAPPAPPSPPGLATRTEPAAQGGVGDVFAGVGSLIKGLLGFIYS